MNSKEEKIKKFLELFKREGSLIFPERISLEKVLDNLIVTDSPALRYYKKEVNIISPFYYYMSNTMKVIVSLVVVALLVGGAAYLSFVGDDEAKLGMSTDETAESSLEEQSYEDTVDGDIDSLLASVEAESLEETDLLAGDLDESLLAEEDLLLADINNTYQNEL